MLTKYLYLNFRTGRGGSRISHLQLGHIRVGAFWRKRIGKRKNCLPWGGGQGAGHFSKLTEFTAHCHLNCQLGKIQLEKNSILSCYFDQVPFVGQLVSLVAVCYHYVMIMGSWSKYDMDGHYFIFTVQILRIFANNYVL